MPTTHAIALTQETAPLPAPPVDPAAAAASAEHVQPAEATGAGGTIATSLRATGA